jgi:hypothetical protein
MLGIYELLYAMYMSQLYFCVKKCGRNGEKPRPVCRTSKDGATANSKHYAKWLSRQAQWHDKPIAPSMLA